MRMQRGSVRYTLKAVEADGIMTAVIVNIAVGEENDEDPAARPTGPRKWMHTKQTVARHRPTANELTARSAVSPHLVIVAMSVETVIVAGTVTLTVPALETQTDVKTNASAFTALVEIPVEVVMSLIMVVVLVLLTLAVWPVVTADADVTVIPRVWLAVSGTDVRAVSAARVRESPDRNGPLFRKKRSRMRRKMRRPFTLAARKERLKRSRWGWTFSFTLDHMQVISALQPTCRILS